MDSAQAGSLWNSLSVSSRMRGCRPLTEDEIGRVLSAFEGPSVIRDRAIFIASLKTGLRISSTLSLRVGDVSHDGKIRSRIRIRRAALKGRRAGIDMPLHAEAVTALQLQLDSLADRHPEAYVFPGRDRRTALNRIRAWRIIKATFASAGLHGARGELGCHSTRKTYAQRIYEALGHDLIRTSYAMRHANVATTIRYLSFEESDVDAAILSL